jgi:hypothetical protein
MVIGLNAMSNAHVDPGLSVPHVEPVTGNSAALLLVMLWTITAEPPTLLIVIVFVGLMFPTA